MRLASCRRFEHRALTARPTAGRAASPAGLGQLRLAWPLLGLARLVCHIQSRSPKAPPGRQHTGIGADFGTRIAVGERRARRNMETETPAGQGQAQDPSVSWYQVSAFEISGGIGDVGGQRSGHMVEIEISHRLGG